MRQHKGDMWELARKISLSGGKPLIMITTNGYVKANGCGVMGAGCAKDAKEMFEGVDKALGEAITERGNRFSYLGTWTLGDFNYPLFSFPVKEHWRQKAKPELIEQSIQYAQGLTRKIPDATIIIPRPGCGNGGLDWQTEVQPLLAPYINDQMIFVYK